MSGNLLGSLAALSVVGLAGAAVIFFAFPRLTLGALRRPSRSQPAAGLSDHVDLRGHGVVADDPRIVLRARLDPDPGVERLALHWRARSLEVWTGRGWRSKGGAPVPRAGFPAPPHGLRPPRKLLVADLEAVSGFTDGVVLTPEGFPIGVQFIQPLTARALPVQVSRLPSGDLVYAPAQVGDLRYVVTVAQAQPSAEVMASRSAPPAGRLEEELEVPADLDPRIAQLSDQLTRGKSAGEAAVAVRDWLETNLTYTRELPGEVDDPIADFLFARKQGHCELFSSAMVLLLRHAGIPARNVTGYYGGVRTTAGYYAVRAGDAHSWAEVWLPGAGFVLFDPTPPAQRGAQQDGLWAKVLLAWDAVAARWRAAVVDYDLLAQGRALRSLSELAGEAGRRLSGRGASGAGLRPLLWPLLLLVALVLLRTWRARWSHQGRRAHGTRPGPDQERARRLWRDARKALRSAGLELPVSATCADTLRHATQLEPAARDALQSLAERAQAARWGGAPLQRAEARALLARLRRAL